MYLFRDQIPHYFEEKYAPRFASLSRPEACASVFSAYLEEIPLFIEPEDLFAGHYGYKDILPGEVQAVLAGYQQKLQRGHEEYFRNMSAPDPYVLLDDLYMTHGAPYDLGHHTIDYQRILAVGLNGCLAEVQKELSVTPKGSEKEQYLKGMKIALSASAIFSDRFAALAEKMAQGADSQKDKARLLKIAAACKKVPMSPPEDLFEAIQSTYLLWTLDNISDSLACSISFGSFDQYMYPYYLMSKKKKVSDEEIKRQLLSFFRLIDDYIGQDSVLSVGGKAPDGKDLTNAFSRLLVSAEKESKLRAPLFVARINENTPEDFMEALVDPLLFQKGQPTFYSEEGCKKAVMHRGVDEKTAQRYSINSCMGMIIPGEEIPSMWGCVFNMHLPLELAVNGGAPLMGVFPFELKTEPVYEYRNVEELYEQYQKYLAEIFSICIEYNRKKVSEGAKERPNPWVSALMPNCVKTGLDRWGGGAVYQTITVECFCFGMTGDAFTAIDELVFKKKKYTLDQMIEAAQYDYEGFEELRSEILACPKYGRNDPRADDNVRRVLDMMATLCEESHSENRWYLPSLHTLTFDVIRGEKCYATLDGRLAGQPLNKNAGPTNSVRSGGPTLVALSAMNLDQYRLGGGQPIDLNFSMKTLETPEKRKKVEALIRTYLSCGGLQVNVNALSAQVLRRAYDHPNEYPDLIVRIGGHSRYFREMRNEVKLEFINRIGIEEGAGA